MAQVVQFYQHGGPDALQIIEQPSQHPGPGEVVIDVKAFGVQRADTLWRTGQYIEAPQQFPTGLGYDCVGVIKAIGDGVSPWKVGDRVTNLPGFSLTEYAVYGNETLMHQDCLISLPQVELSWAEYAAVSIPYFTAYFPLFEAANLPEAQVIVITAAASSVGIAAMQMAKDNGVTIIGTSRTHAKKDKILDLGADYFIATDDDDVVEHIRSIVGDRGVDIVFDPIGGAMIGRWYQVIKRAGHIIHYGLLDVTDAVIPMVPALANAVKLNAYIIFEYTGHNGMGLMRNQAAIARATRYITTGFEKGTFTPVIDKIFPLDAVADAHRYLESNHQVGKIVVTT